MNKSIFLIGTRWFGILGPTKEIIEKLVSEDYDVYVFGQKDNRYHRYFFKNCKLININMKRSYKSFLYDIFDIFKIIYFIIKLKPKAIHSFNPKPAFIAFFSLIFFPKIKFFVGITGLGNTFIRAKKMEFIISRIFRLVAKRSNFIFFQNLDDIEMFKTKKIGNSKKYKLFIGPGVDLKIFTLGKSKNKENNLIRVLCVSRLIWQKGIKEFCESAKILLKKYKNLEFLLIGEFDYVHPDRVYKKDLKKYINEGIIKHIEWTDDVHKYYKLSDIFFLHSYREGAPRAILEASATGLPTVGSNCIGVRELVIDNETGFLVEFKKIEECITALQKLIENKNLRKEMGINARKKIAEPYSLVESTNAQLQMYRETNLI